MENSVNLRVEVRIYFSKHFYTDGESFGSTDFYVISNHIETLVGGTDIDLVIVRSGYPDIAYRIHSDSGTNRIYLDLNSRVSN